MFPRVVEVVELSINMSVKGTASEEDENEAQKKTKFIRKGIKVS